MKVPPSKVGVTVALLYIVLAGYAIATQGLFGESFIALILGLPWSLLFAAVEYGQASGILLYLFILSPLALNALLLYWLGSFIIGELTKGRSR